MVLKCKANLAEHRFYFIMEPRL